MGTLTLSLADPALGLLERLGVAGLAAALDAAKSLEHDLGALTWQRGARELVMRWPEDVTAKDALTPVIEWAWQTRGAAGSDPAERLGVLYFPAVHADHRDNIPSRLTAHQGVMFTFLQHSRIQPRTKDALSREFDLGDDRRVVVSYKEPKCHLAHHKRFARLFVPPRKTSKPKKTTANKTTGKKSAMARKSTESNPPGAAGPAPGDLVAGLVDFESFLVPGATARHRDEPSWQGTAIQALTLFFTPAVCFYFAVYNTDDWVVVAPDVRDLDIMVAIRRDLHLGRIQGYVGSAGDAALRALSAMRAHPAARRLERRQGQRVECAIIQVGKVIWNKQRVRNRALRLSPGEESIERYRVLERHLPDQFRRYKTDGEKNARKTKARKTTRASGRPGNGFIQVPTPRGRIAENLVRDQYWYRDLFRVPKSLRARIEKSRGRGESIDRAWFRHIRDYHHQALRAIMTEITAMNDSPPHPATIPDSGPLIRADAAGFDDQAFTEAFHDAMRRLFRREAERARQGSRTVRERFEDLVDATRREITRARTRTLLRGALASFFSRAGRSAPLEAHGRVIWQMIDHPRNWRRARDLALLSLATYPRKHGEDREDPAGDPDNPRDADPSDDTTTRPITEREPS